MALNSKQTYLKTTDTETRKIKTQLELSQKTRNLREQYHYPIEYNVSNSDRHRKHHLRSLQVVPLRTE